MTFRHSYNNNNNIINNNINNTNINNNINMPQTFSPSRQKQKTRNIFNCKKSSFHSFVQKIEQFCQEGEEEDGIETSG